MKPNICVECGRVMPADSTNHGTNEDAGNFFVCLQCLAHDREADEREERVEFFKRLKKAMRPEYGV